MRIKWVVAERTGMNTTTATAGHLQSEGKRLRDRIATLDFLLSAYEYREYLRQSVGRDLNKKYKRTSLGYVWSMLNPLFMMIVLTVVFSKIMSRVEFYSVFLFCALLAWQYFSSTVNGTLDSVRSNLNIIEQVAVPKFIFALSSAASNVANLLLALIPLLAVMLVVGKPIPWTIVFFPVVLIPLLIVTMGFSLLFAVGNVFFEDTTHLTSVLTKAWYYLTPILYGREHLPEGLVGVIEWANPIFFVVEHFRSVFYFGEIPPLIPYLYSLMIGLLLLELALQLFRRVEDKFIYFA